MMKLIVDRIEEGIAVCEKDDLSRINIPLSDLPDGTSEGSVIMKDDNGEYTLDRNQEAERRKRMLELQKNLFKKQQ